jgi:hypothetical protein
MLINTKGDIDGPMKDILNMQINSLITLQQGNMEIANIYVILN